MSDEVGFTQVPSHYAGLREVIDAIRDRYGDRDTVAFCRMTADVYERRIGRKAGSDDAAKARWYREMADHIKFPDLIDDPGPAARILSRINAKSLYILSLLHLARSMMDTARFA